jgi:hypothetical protein
MIAPKKQLKTHPEKQKNKKIFTKGKFLLAKRAEMMYNRKELGE